MVPPQNAQLVVPSRGTTGPLTAHSEVAKREELGAR